MENLEKYTFNTRSGKVLSTEPFRNGNMLRSTAELMFLNEGKLENSFLPIGLYIDYIHGVQDFQIRSGVYSRFSTSLENTTIDDYLVLGTSRGAAQLILFAARQGYGAISVDGIWSFKQFLFRFQGMWQHLRISAGEDIGFVGHSVWALALYMAAKEPITNQDNWVLSHIMVETYNRSENKSWICDNAIAFWKSKKTKSTSQIMAEYTGIPDHPLVQAWKPYD